MSIIKEINDSLKPKDPVEEAIRSLEPSLYELDDEQVESLVDYMKEMVTGATKRGSVMDVHDAAGLALEDVAGFETAPRKVLNATITRLVDAYLKKFGK